MKFTNRTYANRQRKKKYISTFPRNDVTGANQNFLHRDTTNGFVGLDCEEPKEKENRDNSRDSKTSWFGFS